MAKRKKTKKVVTEISLDGMTTGRVKDYHDPGTAPPPQEAGRTLAKSRADLRRRNQIIGLVTWYVVAALGALTALAMWGFVAWALWG